MNEAPPFLVAAPEAFQLAFDPQRGGPEQITFPQLRDWTTHDQRGIKYYSGTATYHLRFDLEHYAASSSPIWLNPIGRGVVSHFS